MKTSPAYIPRNSRNLQRVVPVLRTVSFLRESFPFYRGIRPWRKKRRERRRVGSRSLFAAFAILLLRLPISPSSDYLLARERRYFTLCGVMVHGPLRLSPFLPSPGLVSLVASSVDTPRSFALRPRSPLFFFSNSPLVTRSPRTRRKETAPL